MSFRITISALVLLIAASLSAAGDQARPKPLWVTAYYPVYEQTSGFTPDKIDYSAITDLVHFSIVPRPDGTIADTREGDFNAITLTQSAEVVKDGHRAGVKVLVCLGGAASGPAISRVITDAIRATFVKNLVDYVSNRHYDGLDIDMEPINSSDEANFVKFIHELRAAMKTVNPDWLLTIPASGEPGDQPRLCALLKNDFDQINIQTYDLSGNWEGFKTWYNGSLYGEGSTLMTSTQPYPSLDEKVQLYLKAGVPKAKLGIGVAFFGYVWTGASGPMQGIQDVSISPIGYNEIMAKYFQPSLYHWDPEAYAPYLSIGSPNSADGKFISYDDARLARDKVLYARKHGLGGVIIWELGQGYQADQPPGRKDVLLTAIKHAAQVSMTADSSSAY